MGLSIGVAAGLTLSVTAKYWAKPFVKPSAISNHPGTIRAAVAQLAYGDPKYRLLFCLLLGAGTSFTLAFKGGKQGVIFMGDVFSRGSRQDQIMTGYQQRNVEAGGGLAAKQREMEAAMNESFKRRLEALQRKKEGGSDNS
jgi:hypothetical protein